METKLERKMEQALAARLKQNTGLARLRMRYTSEDNPKVNQDIVITSKRGDGNPPFSGIYNQEITATFTMRHRKTVETLPEFLKICAAIEEVFNVATYKLAREISLMIPDFHCYEIAVTGSDDTPQENKHSCVWSLTAIAMGQSYANAVKISDNV